MHVQGITYRVFRKRSFIMIGDKIRELRDKNGLTQSSLAKRLQISRSAVNAWEMGISVPSTQYIVELADYFNVSTDYILEIGNDETVNISFLTESEKEIVYRLLKYFKKCHHLPETIKADTGFQANEDLAEILNSGEI